MAALDADMAVLYQKPLSEFTAARNDLARRLSGTDKARVRQLAKPAIVPWSVNQVYWHARPVFDRARAAGEALRTAQINVLKGKSADVRDATEVQRKAIADAVRESLRMAAAAGARPSADALTRMWEAVSLSPELPEPAGQFTTILQPLGFAALAGVTPSAHVRMPTAQPQPRSPSHDRVKHHADRSRETKTHEKEDEREHKKGKDRDERRKSKEEAAEKRVEARRAEREAAAARRALAAAETRASRTQAALSRAADLLKSRQAAVAAAEREEMRAREAHARAASEAAAAQADVERLRPR